MLLRPSMHIVYKQHPRPLFLLPLPQMPSHLSPSTPPLPPHRHRHLPPILLPTRPPPHPPPQQRPRSLPQPLRILRLQLVPLIRHLPLPLLLLELLLRLLLLLPPLLQIPRFLRPHKGPLPRLALHELDRHFLRRARPAEAARAVVAHHFALDEVGAHAQDLHPVQVVEVVLEVELVEPERGEEGGEVGRLGGRAEEGEGEVWSLSDWGGFVSCWVFIIEREWIG